MGSDQATITLSDEGEKTYTRLRRFLSHPDEEGYMFVSVDDQRLISLLNQRLRNDVPGLNVLTLSVSDRPSVQELLEAAEGFSALVINNVPELARRRPNFLQSLNFAREQLNSLHKPIAFWLTPATLRDVASRAADLYSQRRYSSLYFDDTLPADSIREHPIATKDDSDVATKQAHIRLLENQLQAAKVAQRSPLEISRTIALPLAGAYADDWQGDRALNLIALYDQYLDKTDANTVLSMAKIHEQAQSHNWAITYYEQAAERNLASIRSTAYSRLGSLHQTLGQLEEARNYFEKNLALSQELYAANPRAISLAYGLANAYLWLGLIESKRNDVERALSNYQRALPLLEMVVAMTPIPEYTSRLAFVKEATASLER